VRYYYYYYYHYYYCHSYSYQKSGDLELRKDGAGLHRMGWLEVVPRYRFGRRRNEKKKGI